MLKPKFLKKIAAVSVAMVMAASASSVALTCSAWSVNQVIKSLTQMYTNGKGGIGVYSKCTVFGGGVTFSGYFDSKTHTAIGPEKSKYTSSVAEDAGVSVTYTCGTIPGVTSGTVSYYV